MLRTVNTSQPSLSSCLTCAALSDATASSAARPLSAASCSAVSSATASSAREAAFAASSSCSLIKIQRDVVADAGKVHTRHFLQQSLALVGPTYALQASAANRQPCRYGRCASLAHSRKQGSTSPPPHLGRGQLCLERRHACRQAAARLVPGRRPPAQLIQLCLLGIQGGDGIRHRALLRLQLLLSSGQLLAQRLGGEAGALGALAGGAQLRLDLGLLVQGFGQPLRHLQPH